MSRKSGKTWNLKFDDIATGRLIAIAVAQVPAASVLVVFLAR